VVRKSATADSEAQPCRFCCCCCRLLLLLLLPPPPPPLLLLHLLLLLLLMWRCSLIIRESNLRNYRTQIYWL
jgi:hypothetical protein